MAKRDNKSDEARKAILEGRALASKHPLFAALFHLAGMHERREKPSHKGFWCQIIEPGKMRWGDGWTWPVVSVDFRRRAEPEHWAYVLARAYLQIGLNHSDPSRDQIAWQAACDLFAADFMERTKVGRRPEDLFAPPGPLPRQREEDLYRLFREDGIPDEYEGFGLAGPGLPTFVFPNRDKAIPQDVRDRRSAVFAQGMRAAVQAAVDVAGGVRRELGREANPKTEAQRAKAWFVSSYPLLASLAASFKIIDDEDLCEAMGISIAAVSGEAREIYVNPRAFLSFEQMKFVIAHELLHIGLRHDRRCQGRDPYLWNIACDFVINGWLIEMDVGEMPEDGLLYDPDLGGESAEALYDRIVGDLRLRRKCAKLRTPKGIGQPDILDNRSPAWWTGPGIDLDTFYRRCLAEGLRLYSQGRGYLPADLVEEIRALNQPPIPWDVELAQWLDQFFPAIEKRRSFARASRRQSASPDIPRPQYVTPPEQLKGRTFGVVIDTSGSMSRVELGKAVGAIASYAMSRDVTAVRIVQCDARPHDIGYVEPESLLDRVTVRGRGGTVLQPALDMLQRKDDFPPDGPILMITDGYCDRLAIKRSHAFLLPEGGRLPFRPVGPVFHFS